MRVRTCHPTNRYSLWERAFYQHERYHERTSYMVKKNKRWEGRGSTEEELKCKRFKTSQHAASATVELTEPKEVHSTPTLAHIHGILQCVQNSVTSMNKLGIDLAKLKSFFKTQETKLKNTQEALKGALEGPWVIRPFNFQFKIEN